MPVLIDTCLWIDFTRMRSPRALKQFIAPIAIHHHAEIISFDDDFVKIAGISTLKVKLLKRPS